MKVSHTIRVDMPQADIFPAIMTALGHGPSFKLMADTPTDTVNGAVTARTEIYTLNGVTQYTDVHVGIVVTTTAEPPNEAHETTFAPAAVIPTAQELVARLDGMAGVI